MQRSVGTWSLVAAALTVLLFVESCGDEELVAPASTEPEPTVEDRGIELTPASSINLEGLYYVDLVWNQNGNEIIFSTPQAIGAANVAIRATRTLVYPQDTLCTSLKISSHGPNLFYLRGDPAYWTLSGKKYRLYRLSLAGSSPEMVSDFNCNGYTISPDGGILVYSKRPPSADAVSDSLILYDIDTRNRTVLYVSHNTRDDLPPVFSPDGTEVLWNDQSAGIVVSTNTGVVRPLGFDLSGWTIACWDYEGLKVCRHHSGPSVTVHNITTGTDHTAGVTGQWDGSDWAGVSRDGKKFAVWTWKNLSSDYPGVAGYRLYVIDVENNVSTRIAYGRAPWLLVSSAVFSPDGTQLAYVLDYRIYLKDLR